MDATTKDATTMDATTNAMDYEEKVINGENMISFKGVWYSLGDFWYPGMNKDEGNECEDNCENNENPLDYDSGEEVYDMYYLE
jgi:hypothetical protein